MAEPYVSAVNILRLLKDIKALWDREGFGSNDAESEPIYYRLSKAVEELTEATTPD